MLQVHSSSAASPTLRILHILVVRYLTLRFLPTQYSFHTTVTTPPTPLLRHVWSSRRSTEDRFGFSRSRFGDITRLGDRDGVLTLLVCESEDNVKLASVSLY